MGVAEAILLSALVFGAPDFPKVFVVNSDHGAHVRVIAELDLLGKTWRRMQEEKNSTAVSDAES